MTPTPQPRDDAEIERRLTASRPVPTAAFRGELRRNLVESRAGEARPPRLRLLVAAYAGSGGVLLAVVLLGLAGAGPFAAG